MEKPPMKKRRGPYGKRNYDSELQPIPLTLENPETNTCIFESTSTLQDTAVSVGPGMLPRYFTRSISKFILILVIKYILFNRLNNCPKNYNEI